MCTPIGQRPQHGLVCLTLRSSVSSRSCTRVPHSREEQKVLQGPHFNTGVRTAFGDGDSCFSESTVPSNWEIRTCPLPLRLTGHAAHWQGLCQLSEDRAGPGLGALQRPWGGGHLPTPPLPVQTLGHQEADITGSWEQPQVCLVLTPKSFLSFGSLLSASRHLGQVGVSGGRVREEGVKNEEQAS